MLMIYYGCGLRRGEGVALNVADIHLSEGLIHVRRSKTGRARYVPLSPAAIGDLQIWCTEGRNHFTPLPSERALFLNPQGQRLSAQALAIRLKKLSQRAELATEVSLHGLRHAIATHLLEAGMGIAYISRFLGHQSLESTQRYTHLHR
jgi:site-specific recombinase XerD